MSPFRLPGIEPSASGACSPVQAEPSSRRRCPINEFARRLQRFDHAAEGEDLLRCLIRGVPMNALQAGSGLSQRTIGRRIDTFGKERPGRHRLATEHFQRVLLHLIMDDILYWRPKTREVCDPAEEGAADATGRNRRHDRQMIALTAYRNAKAVALKLLEPQDRTKKRSR